MSLDLYTSSGSLLYDDSPEFISLSIGGVGYTFEQDIPAGQTTRVFLYHMNNIYTNNLSLQNAVIGLACKSKHANNTGTVSVEKVNNYADNFLNPYNNTNLGKATALQQYLNGIGDYKNVPSDSLICVSPVGVPTAFFNMILDITPNVDITVRAFITNNTSIQQSNVFSMQPASHNGPAGMFNYVSVVGGTIESGDSCHIMDCWNQSGTEFLAGSDGNYIDGNFGIPYSINCANNVNQITLFTKSDLNDTKPLYICYGDGNTANSWQVGNYTFLYQQDYRYYSLTINMQYFAVNQGEKVLNLCLPGGSYGHIDVDAN